MPNPVRLGIFLHMYMRYQLMRVLYFFTQNPLKHGKFRVFITLAFDDTYSVHIISTHGNIKQTFDMVYFDVLTEIIDNRIEKIKDYRF